MINTQSSIYRLFSDLVKADNVIAVDELDFLDGLCRQFSIGESDIIAAYQITLAQAANHLASEKKDMQNAILSLMLSTARNNGGFCSRNESVMIEMFTNVYTNVNTRVASVASSLMPAEQPFILYVENRERGACNALMETDDDYFADLENIARNGGFELVHIPRISRHYSKASDRDLSRLVRLVSPINSSDQLKDTLRRIKTMTAQDFYQDVLLDKLNLPLDVKHPIWLIKIGNSVVDGVDYSNLLCMDVEKDVKKQLGSFVGSINSRMPEFPIMVNSRRDNDTDFLYRGFHRTLLDVMSIKKLESWEIHFRTYGDDAQPFEDPQTGKKTVCAFFKDGECVPLQVSARDAAFYLLMLFSVALGESAADFADDESNRRNMRRYEFLYQRLSKRSIDGETEFKRCPDITQPQTRIPMKSRLSTAIKSSSISEKSLYLPQEKVKNVLGVPVDASLVFIETPRGSYRLSDLADEMRSGDSAKHNLLAEYRTL